MLTYLLILLGTLARFLPHLPNFVPVTAIILFSGYRLRKRDAFLVPLATMLVSDYFLGGYYGVTMFYVYGSYLLIGLIGLFLRRHRGFFPITLATVSSSLIFYIVTNFGVWANPLFFYPRTMAGLIECYVAGLPFFRNTLLGDLFYSAAIFGLYEAAQRLNLKKSFFSLK